MWNARTLHFKFGDFLDRNKSPDNLSTIRNHTKRFFRCQRSRNHFKQFERTLFSVSTMVFNELVVALLILSMLPSNKSESLVKFVRSECHVNMSVPGHTGMIVNGQISPRGKWPWLVALSTKSDGEFFCGGSLISERFVLSAAHCLQYKNEQTPKEPKDVIVSLGKWNISDKQELGALELTPFEFIIHPDWKISESRWNADIALIKLETDVTFSSSITPICLWTSKMRPEEMNDGGTAVGW